MKTNPTDRDKNWQKGTYVIDDTYDDALTRPTHIRMLSFTLKAQGLSGKVVRLMFIKAARRKVARLISMRERRECPNKSYVFLFFTQKLVRLPVWED